MIFSMQYLRKSNVPPTEQLPTIDIILSVVDELQDDEEPFRHNYLLPPNVTYADHGRAAYAR